MSTALRAPKRKAVKRGPRDANRIVQILRKVVANLNRAAEDHTMISEWKGIYKYKPRVEIAKAITLAANIHASKTTREKKLPGDVGALRKPTAKRKQGKGAK